MSPISINGVDLPELLTMCQNPQYRVNAEQKLEGLQASHPFQLFPGLAMVLAGEGYPIVIRQLAGLVLKNAFSGSKDGARERQSHERWNAMSKAGEPGTLIKRNIVQALTTAKDLVARKTAAQVISAIAAIEIPEGKWGELIDSVLLPSVNPSKDVLCRSSALICLSYMSEEFTGRSLEVPQPLINSMLTAIIQGMKDADESVKKDAAKALYYAMVLARTNFENTPERDVIVSTICEGVKIGLHQPNPSKTSLEVCMASCECLVQMATEYYIHLGSYMNVIGPLTWEMMKLVVAAGARSPPAVENLGMCAIEFWSTVCDEENYIRECIEVEGPESVHASSQLAHRGLKFLVPLLTELMSKFSSSSDDDDEEADTWNAGMAAATCLGLLAQATGDEVVDPVLLFVNANYNSSNAHLREAAMLAYGSIMDGPSPAKMNPLIHASLSVIVEALGDQSLAVRDNAAWTIGRVCQFHTKAIAPAIGNLIPILLTKLAQDKPRVAANVAWTMDVLGRSQEESPHELAQLGGPMFTQIVGTLLTACQRPDAGVRNLRLTGYAAVSSLAGNAGKELSPALLSLLDEMCVRLEQSLAGFRPLLALAPGAGLSEEMRSAIASLSQSEKDCELQGHICGCMQVVTNRLRKSHADLNSRAEKMMTLYMHVFALYQRLSSNVHEETLLAVSSLALCLGPKFARFMPTFFPVLKLALANHESFQVCAVAVGVVGDLSRSLDKDLIPFAGPLMRDCLAPLLERTAVDRKLKPLVMTALGDVALATRDHFEPFVPGTIQLLSQAACTRLEDGPVDSEEWVEYLNELRLAVLDAFTGMVHGLREANRHDILREHVQPMLEFVVRLIDDKSVSEDVISAAMGLVGDLVMSYQHDLARLIKEAPFMQRLIAFAAASKDKKVQETGQWLAKTVDKFN